MTVTKRQVTPYNITTIIIIAANDISFVSGGLTTFNIFGRCAYDIMTSYNITAIVNDE